MAPKRSMTRGKFLVLSWGIALVLVVVAVALGRAIRPGVPGIALGFGLVFGGGVGLWLLGFITWAALTGNAGVPRSERRT